MATDITEIAKRLCGRWGFVFQLDMMVLDGEKLI